MIKNVSYTLLAKIVAMVFYLATDIVVARMLNIDGYSEWTYFYSVATMLGYVTWFGINASVKVFVSKQNDEKERTECLRAGLILRLLISIFFAVLIMALSYPFAKVLGYPDKYANLDKLILMSGAMVFTSSFTEFFKETSIGLERYKDVLIITTIEFGLNFLFSFMGICIYHNPTAVAAGYIIAGILELIAGCMIYRQYIVIDKDIKSKLDTARITALAKKIMKYAIPLVIISFGGMVLIEMDTVMLGMLSSREQVSVYAVAKKLCQKATHINYALCTGTMTAFSVITYETIVEKRKKFNKLCGINILVAVTVSLGFIIAGPLAIKILYGSEYREAGDVIRLLTPYYILYSISNFYSLFLDFHNKATFRSLCYVLTLVINLILNWMLIPPMGANGAAIATAVSLIPYTVLVIIQTEKIFAKYREK